MCVLSRRLKVRENKDDSRRTLLVYMRLTDAHKSAACVHVCEHVWASLCRVQADKYPGLALFRMVWSRVLTRSKGWKSSVEQVPLREPHMKALRAG